MVKRDNMEKFSTFTLGYHIITTHESCVVLTIDIQSDRTVEEEESDGVGYQHVCCVRLEC